MMTEKEIKNIALKLFQGKASPEEEEILHRWYDAKNASAEKLFVLTDHEVRDDVRERLYTSIETTIAREKPDNTIRRFLKNRRIVNVAASILLFFIIGGFYFYSQRKVDEGIHYTQLLDGDVGPGGYNATIELGDGSIINLDSASVGDLGALGGIRVSKQADGVLSIELSKSSKNATNEINTIKTPAGGQYQVTLPDGTKVLLNASSSIAFPSSFAKDYREVELRGEAYFEVAKVLDDNNKRIPFFVLDEDQRIEVLGTHFNVYNYVGESTRTTLVEGSVRVVSLASKSAYLLKPGQQSQLIDGGMEINEADVESTISWKEGDFVFANEELKSIMKKLERWYDVEVEYSSSVVPRRFSGAVSRSKKLSEVLRIMEFTGKVTFKIEERRVTVMM